MALQASQSSQHARSCMPLVKFSYATVPAGSIGPIPWTHVSSQDDLFVILDPYEVSGQTSVHERGYRFRVLQDPNPYEDIDLVLLANEARRAINDAQSTQIAGQQPFISIIVKNPCVAMRYPLQDRQVRRFQVRFAREEDFYETLKVFASMKIPFVEAGAISSAPNPVASSSHHPEPAVTLAGKLGTSVSSCTARPALAPQLRNLGTEPLAAGVSMQLQDGHETNIAFMPTAQPSPFMPFSTSQQGAIEPNTDPNASVENRRDNATSTSQVSLERLAQPDHSSISTFVPRPSTAPVASKPSLDLVLPPKRDLPFGRKAKVPSLAQVSRQAQNKYLAVANIGTNTQKVDELVQEPSQNATEQQAGKGNKRAASKAKRTPATKKPRKLAPRTKNAGTERENTYPTPSQGALQVDESRPDVVSSSRPDLDTQVLLDHAEAIQTAKAAQSTERIPYHQPVNSASHQIVQNLTQLAEHTPDTLSSFSTKSHDPSCYSEPRPNKVNPPNQDPQQTKATSSATHAPPHIGTPSEPTHFQTALAALLANPDFAQTTLPQADGEPDLNFDDLTENQRHEVVETFIIQSIQSDRFFKLCKTLEGVWQRIFAGV